MLSRIVASLLSVLAFVLIPTQDLRAQSCARWSRPTFEPRLSTQMVYDASRQQTVLFGGGFFGTSSSTFGAGPRSGETWVWNGTTWTLIEVPGPSPRSGHSMTYDSIRERVVLFGGTDGATFFNDTWEWDGTRWTRIATSGPSPRAEAAMTFDSARGVVVLHGGGTLSTRFGGTWEWNGAEWTLRSEVGPPARLAHAMAYDPNLNLTILSGGTTSPNNSASFSDLWVWDGNTWTQRATQTVLQRTRAQKVYDVGLKRVVLFGGTLGSFGSSDGLVYSYDGTGWVSRPIGVVTGIARFGHGMAYDIARARLVITAGGIPSSFSSLSLGDTWELSSSWMRVFESNVPSARTNFSFAFDSTRNIAILFGGDNQLRDTWEWNAVTRAWRLVQTLDAPTNGNNTTMVFDSTRAVFVLMGGGREETWEYRPGVGWVGRKLTSPPARSNPAMAFDSDRGVVVMFGGTSADTGTTVPSETWEFNGLAWTLVSTVGPTPRTDTAMAYDPVRRRTVLFGGVGNSSSQALSDTWEWNGQSWTPLNPGSRPSRRRSHAMAFDPIAQRVVLTGGVQSSSFFEPGEALDIFEWDGANWIARAVSNPPLPRLNFGLAFNTLSGRPLVFGGQFASSSSSGNSNELWDLARTLAPVLPSSAITVALNSGAQISLSVPASGTPDPSYRWSRNGVELADDERVSGSSTPSLGIIGLTPADTGQYSVRATNTCASVSAVIADLTVRCPGDANGDNVCDGADLAVLLGGFNQSVPAGTSADFNGDAQINNADLSQLLFRFNQSCDSSPKP